MINISINTMFNGYIESDEYRKYKYNEKVNNATIREIREEYDLYDTLQTLCQEQICYLDYYQLKKWYYYIIDFDANGNCNKYVFEIDNKLFDNDSKIKPQMTVKELVNIIKAFDNEYED